MNALTAGIAIVWVWICLGLVLVAIPTLVLGRRLASDSPSGVAGPALVWTWGAIALLVPATAMVRGFNWATAILICAIVPVSLWLSAGGGPRAAFGRVVRLVVLRAVTARPSSVRLADVARRRAVWALAIGAGLILAAASADVRLTVPADFDTLWRTQQLLRGTPTWDPVAALAALAARISTVDTLLAVVAIRVGLVTMTAAAASLFIVHVAGRRSFAAMVPLPLLAAARQVPLGVWAFALFAIVAATGLARWRRHRTTTGGWDVAIASLLAATQLAAVPALGTLRNETRTAAPLEHPAAASETLRLARLSNDIDWMLVGPPEQGLEIDARGRFYDLLAFVTRFDDRAGRRDFRFDLPAKRLYVMVEKEPLDVGGTAPGVLFLAAQPAAYRVQRERDRLERAARRLCDDYRRTHAGTAIAYEDAVLRVYQFEL